MALLSWLIVGLIGGALGLYAAYRTFPSGAGEWIGALAVGVIGGWLGGFILSLVGLEAVGFIGSLVVAFLGAWAIFYGYRQKTHPTEDRIERDRDRQPAGHDREREGAGHDR